VTENYDFAVAGVALRRYRWPSSAQLRGVLGRGFCEPRPMAGDACEPHVHSNRHRRGDLDVQDFRMQPTRRQLRPDPFVSICPLLVFVSDGDRQPRAQGE